MPLSNLFSQIGKILGGQELALLQRKAQEALLRAHRTLNKAILEEQEAPDVLLEREQKEIEAQDRLYAEERKQQRRTKELTKYARRYIYPVLGTPYAQAKTIPEDVVLREMENLTPAQLTRLKSTKQRRFKLRNLRDLQRNRDRGRVKVDTAQVGVVTAQRRVKRAKVNLADSRIRRIEAQEKREDVRKNLARHRRPVFQPGKVIDTFTGTMGSLGTAAAGFGAGGMAGAVPGLLHAGFGATGGLAMAAGGPYGPALAKGVEALSTFADTVLKAGFAVVKWTETQREGILALSHASPSMSIVNTLREFGDFMEDLGRGEPTAHGQAIVEQARMRRRSEERESDVRNKQTAQRTNLFLEQGQARWERNRRRVLREYEESGQETRAKAESLIFGGGWWNPLNWPGLTYQGLEAKFNPEPQEQKEQQEFEEASKAGMDVVKDFSDRLTEMGFDPSKDPLQAGGFYQQLQGEHPEHLGGARSFSEVLSRMGRGESWHESWGRPHRFN